MQTSDEREDRELASLWLDAFWAQTEDRERDEALLSTLAANGSTARVRFEAVMTLARLRTAADRFDDAIRLYGQALELTTDDPLRDLARRERQRAIDHASPFVGIGDVQMLVAGRRTVQPRSVHRNAANVQYTLDGRRAAVSTKRPFIVSIDFGRSPRRQTLQLVAFDQKGRELQRTAMVVNERSDAFDVRITQPASLVASGTVAVAVSATVPRGRRIEWLAIEWNGRPVTRLVAPPFATSVEVAEGEEGILRAVVRLDDGSESEDVRLLNAGAVTMASRVHLVELPVHVAGKPPLAKDVMVLENGNPRPVDRIIPASDAPLRIALLLDTSASMANHLLDLQESAIRFVEQNLGDADRAMVVAFGTGRGVLWPTADRDQIARMILRQQALGGTALFDALITGLLNVQSAGCRRAIVVFTDGVDTSSTFTFDDVHTVARRMAIPIYVLLFQPGGLAPPEQFKLARSWKKFGEQTGGRVFSLHSLDEIGTIWTEIARELDRQSLVVFRTDPSATSWRALKIRAPGFSLRAPAGIDVSEDHAEVER
jgi:VWFA-related protein